LLQDREDLAVTVSGRTHRKLLCFILKEFSTNDRSGFMGGLQLGRGAQDPHPLRT